jgi:hypothetical protein
VRASSFIDASGVSQARVDLSMIGQEVEVTGTVREEGGVTELADARAVITSPRPAAARTTVLSAAEANDEAYEGVLVTLQNVTVQTLADKSSVDGIFTVSDASGSFAVSGFINDPGYRPILNSVLSSITGIVHQGTGPRYLVLRSAADVVQ